MKKGSASRSGRLNNSRFQKSFPKPGTGSARAPAALVSRRHHGPETVGEAEDHLARKDVRLERCAVKVGVVVRIAELTIGEGSQPRPDLIFEADKALYRHTRHLIFERLRAALALELDMRDGDTDAEADIGRPARADPAILGA